MRGSPSTTRTPAMPASICHVVHLIYHLGTGGLENVVVQLINHLPRDRFRHTVIAITDIDPAFARRVDTDSVELIALNKPPGQPFRLFPRVYRLLRQLRPDVVHSCNLAALEFSPVSALARVPLRVHAEHGLDIGEIRGKRARYRMLRKIYNPFVSHYVAVSTEQAALCEQAGVAKERVHLIPNGVDTARFRPRSAGDALPEGFPFQPGHHWVIGTVGRQADIKNPLLLVEAFVALVQSGAPAADRARLALVGDGPLNQQIAARMRQAGMEHLLWLPGVRADVPEILRALDCFVLPSLSEGTSCALQEAMASRLSIVATGVGGNGDVLEDGRCGDLVPSGDVQAMALQLMKNCQAGIENPQRAAALASAQERYSLDRVIQRYRDVFLIHHGK
jgi:sugar transferase (PEP-CTERM/EpsH1 system associated)